MNTDTLRQEILQLKLKPKLSTADKLRIQRLQQEIDKIETQNK